MRKGTANIFSKIARHIPTLQQSLVSIAQSYNKTKNQMVENRFLRSEADHADL